MSITKAIGNYVAGKDPYKYEYAVHIMDRLTKNGQNGLEKVYTSTNTSRRSNIPPLDNWLNAPGGDITKETVAYRYKGTTVALCKALNFGGCGFNSDITTIYEMVFLPKTENLQSYDNFKAIIIDMGEFSNDVVNICKRKPYSNTDDSDPEIEENWLIAGKEIASKSKNHQKSVDERALKETLTILDDYYKSIDA